MSQMLFDQNNATSGNSVQVGNLKTFNQANNVQTLVAVSGATVTPNLALGSTVIVSITGGATQVTVAAPTGMPIPLAGGTAAGVEWTLFVQNNSGGALTTGPRVAASGFRVGLAVIPTIANGTGATAQFFFDGTNNILIGGWSVAL